MAYFPRGWGTRVDTQNVFQETTRLLEDFIKRNCLAPPLEADADPTTPAQVRAADIRSVLQSTKGIIMTSRAPVPTGQSRVYFDESWQAHWAHDHVFQPIVRHLAHVGNTLCLGNVAGHKRRGTDLMALCEAALVCLETAPPVPVRTGYILVNGVKYINGATLPNVKIGNTVVVTVGVENGGDNYTLTLDNNDTGFNTKCIGNAFELTAVEVSTDAHKQFNVIDYSPQISIGVNLSAVE